MSSPCKVHISWSDIRQPGQKDESGYVTHYHHVIGMVGKKWPKRILITWKDHKEVKDYDIDELAGHDLFLHNKRTRFDSLEEAKEMAEKFILESIADQLGCEVNQLKVEN